MNTDFSVYSPSFASEEPEEINWQALSKTIHRDNVDKGFWPDDVMDRNVGEALCLIHSELTEAYEASLYPDLMDDKLTDYTALQVEIADAIIRVLDLGAAHGVNFDQDRVDVLAQGFAFGNPFTSMIEDLVELHGFVDAVLEDHRKRSTSAEDGSLLYKNSLVVLLGNLIGVCYKYNIPFEAINAKLAYNRSRPYKHGKKY